MSLNAACIKWRSVEPGTEYFMSMFVGIGQEARLLMLERFRVGIRKLLRIGIAWLDFQFGKIDRPPVNSHWRTRFEAVNRKSHLLQLVR